MTRVLSQDDDRLKKLKFVLCMTFGCLSAILYFTIGAILPAPENAPFYYDGAAGQVATLYAHYLVRSLPGMAVGLLLYIFYCKKEEERCQAEARAEWLREIEERTKRRRGEI